METIYERSLGGTFSPPEGSLGEALPSRHMALRAYRGRRSECVISARLALADDPACAESYVLSGYCDACAGSAKGSCVSAFPSRRSDRWFFIVSMLFGLPFDLALASIGFLKDIDVVASLLYSAGIALLVTIAIVSAYTVNHYRDHLKRASLIPALLAVNALILFDYATNSYNPGMPAKIGRAHV